jgi:GPI biosynthesis protein family Pig-F
MTTAHSLTSRPTTAEPAAAPTYNKPIELLPSPIAQTYAHLHPALLLALFTICFPVLVQDPISALLRGLPLLAVLQGLYVVICLPPARSVSSTKGAAVAAAAAPGAGGVHLGGDMAGRNQGGGEADLGRRVGTKAVRSGGKILSHHRRKHAHGLKAGESASRRVMVCSLSPALLPFELHPFTYQISLLSRP